MSTYGSLYACIGEEMSNQPDPAARAAEEAAKLLPCAGCEEIDNGLIWHAATCPVSFRQFVAAALIAAEQRGREQERAEIADWLGDHAMRNGDYRRQADMIRARGTE